MNFGFIYHSVGAIDCAIISGWTWLSLASRLNRAGEARQSGKWSQMVPMIGANPPAETNATPDSLGSMADVGGLAHPFLERKEALPLCWSILKLLCRLCSAWGSRCPGRKLVMGRGGGGGGKAGAQLAAPVAVSWNPHSGILKAFQRNLGKSCNLVSFGLLGF